MDKKQIKHLAFRAATHGDSSIENDIRGMNIQDRLFYLQMLYYYRLFDIGKIKLNEAKRIEQRINADYEKLNSALFLSQQDYKRNVEMTLKTDIERTRLVKQMRAGDRDFIHTLLHLLDLYTGEGIYNQIYMIMKPPLTDDELDKMIEKCPEKYRRNMNKDEVRATVWRVIHQLNGDEDITKEGV